MTNARRKMAIRAIMAETGMSYTAALRELARRVAVADAAREQQEAGSSDRSEDVS
jgi:hypothetical protein